MPPPSNSEKPETLGPFRLLRVLGSGGMGTVYLGERIEQFTQQVAIKVLHPRLFPTQTAEAVQREADLLAALDHPGIVRMLDLGGTPDGLRYVVMEYVEGCALDVFCDQNRLSLKRRIEILLDIFESVEHAHRRLVIHADLKPENILLSPGGKPRLLDFGVAAAISELGANPSHFEGFTTLYSSPEQRSGERLTVTSDIHSLGLIARQILTGVVPAPVALSSSRSVSLEMPSHALADLPSESQTQIAQKRSTTLQSLLAELRGDLDAILIKATELDSSHRFQSVQEFSDELCRYASGYPILTRPASRVRKLQKWVRRNKLVASLSIAFLVALTLTSVGVVVRTQEARNKRQIAQTRLHELVRLTDVLAGELYDSVHGLQGSEAAQAALLTSAHQTIAKLSAEVDRDPQLQIELAREYDKLARLELHQVPLTKAAIEQASKDISDENEVLHDLPQTDPEAARQRSTISELIHLRDTAVANAKPSR